jgi:hypothetical protein
LKAVALAGFKAKIDQMFDMSATAFKSWPLVAGRANGVKADVLVGIAASRFTKCNVTESTFSLAR